MFPSRRGAADRSSATSSPAGITQTTIVQQSRERMVRVLNASGVGVSPAQSRSIHKAIIDEASNRSVTPRALIAQKDGGVPLIHSIFRRHLTDAEWDALTAKVDPTYLVMHAFEGNLNTVGVTQKITGLAKKHDLTGTVPKITDSIYPKMRFTYRPTFQLQEMIESPFLNALRGITARTMDEDGVQAYRKLAKTGPHRPDQTIVERISGDLFQSDRSWKTHTK